MCKGRYLFKLLSAPVVIFCIYACGGDIAKPSAKTVQRSALKITDQPIRNKLRTTYMSQVGVREMTGRNDGVEVENYLKYVNLSKGNPWCAAFVCWALGENEIENPRSGWSPDLFPKNKIIWERSKKITDLTNEMSSEVILQGDVFGIYFTDKKRIAHCGFVDQANKSWIITVEGNTNDTGGRDGDGVYRKRRLLNTIYTISSWQKQ